MKKRRAKIKKRIPPENTIGEYRIGEEVEVQLRYKVYKTVVMPNGESETVIDFMDEDEIELIIEEDDDDYSWFIKCKI